MHLASPGRALAVAASIIALVVALAHCTSSHPPVSNGGGSDTKGSSNPGCFGPVDGGCSLPLIVSAFAKDTPINDSDALDGKTTGATAQICTDAVVGQSICGDFDHLVTCVAEGVFVVRSSPPCNLDAAAGDADVADAADAESSDAGAD